MQNVNLYLPELRPSREWLNARNLMIATLAYGALVVVVAIMSRQFVNKYEESVIALEEGLSIEKQRVENIKSRQPKNNAVELDQKIETLKGELRNVTNIKDLIGNQNLGNTSGYSLRLNQMAESAPAKIELNKFRFSSGNEKVEMAGKTLDPAVLTEFIDVLQQSSSFESAVFGGVAIQQNEERKTIHDFSIGYDAIFNGKNVLVDVVR